MLLYEVLAGQRPYDLSTLTASEAERVVCHVTPRPPSEAAPPDRARAPWGDLDTVVMAALDKDPARRYASAAALADDLRRVRDGLPPTARPATRGHRARLFVRRHRTAVLAAAAIAVTILAGAGVALWQAAEARAERDRAEARFEIARGAARALLYEVHDAIEALDGSTAARELVLAQSIDYLDRLASDAGDDLALRVDLAEAYYKVGYVQGMPTGQSLGRTGDARESFRRGLDLLPPPALPAPDDTLALRQERIRGRLLEKHATVLAYQGELAQALPELDAAVAVFQRVAAIAPAYDDLATLEAGALVNRGDFAGHPHFPNDGRPDAALADYRAARGVLEAIPASSRHLYTERLWGITFEREGTILAERDDFAGARNAYTRSIEVRRQIVSRDDVNFDARRDLAVSYETFGRLLRAEGRPATPCRTTSGAGPMKTSPSRTRRTWTPSSRSRSSTGTSRTRSGGRGRAPRAPRRGPRGARRALGRFRALAADDPENEYLGRTLAESRRRTAAGWADGP